MIGVRSYLEQIGKHVELLEESIRELEDTNLIKISVRSRISAIRRLVELAVESLERLEAGSHD